MDYSEILENVSVLGAAGKMGSGILLLTAVEMADQSLKEENKGREFVLNAVDVSDAALNGLMKYIRAQARKIAEKKTVALREMYKGRPDLVENGEIIEEYIFDVMRQIRPTKKLEAAHESKLIFEAVSENPQLKVDIYKEIDKNSDKEPWFFTNTSSIPIHKLEDEAKLKGRILGFHFYNPPAVQKLVELIVAENSRDELIQFAEQYARNLRKKIVRSNDFAGFIGNGHFMRDAHYGLNEVERLTDGLQFHEAVYLVNRISQEFLIRPMGIFQLIDYVGVDVCQYIMKVMNPYLEDENLHSTLLDRMMELGIKGGQRSDGSQKDGFLKYEKGKPVAVYNPDKEAYVEIESFKEKVDEKIGPMPDSAIPWKALISMPDKDDKLKRYFTELNAMDTFGAELAQKYLKRSKEIGQKLVADKVAADEKDVNTVLLTGFFHAYGPVNDYVKGA